MVAAKQDTGTDVKSVAINIASILLFLMPFGLYFDRGNAWTYAGVVAIGFLLAFLTPPIGWMRPHPYSDYPNNRPYPRKED